MTDKILIVDDDQAISAMLYKIIRSNGMDAEIASSGEAALLLLNSKSYDLFLLDINMPGMDLNCYRQSVPARYRSRSLL